MEIAAIKANVQDLFVANRLKELFSLLKAKLAPDQKSYHQFLMLKKRYNSYLDRKMAGSISLADGEVLENTISEQLLAFVKSLSDEDLKVQTQFQHEVIDHSLIVFSQTNEKDELVKFFRQLNFNQVQVIDQLPSNLKEAWEKVMFVIFDNRDLGVCANPNMLKSLPEAQQKMIQERISIMDQVVEQSTKFLVHYGDFLFWINNNRDRVHPANSQFALYARIKEMIGFISTYRV